MIITHRTIDHPEANGRQPLPGEQQWTLSFPLENNMDYLEVKIGHVGFVAMLAMIEQYHKDEQER